jgi:hypothetical protein
MIAIGLRGRLPNRAMMAGRIQGSRTSPSETTNARGNPGS